MEHYFLSPEKFKEHSYKLLEEIKKKDNKYQAILCPLRGGFYLSYFMSKHLKLPMVYIEISSYSGKVQEEFQIGLKPELAEGNFLLCDDIYDSGNTIKKIHSLYPHVSFDTACLVSKLKEADIHYGVLVDKNCWVDFFWEAM